MPQPVWENVHPAWQLDSTSEMGMWQRASVFLLHVLQKICTEVKFAEAHNSGAPDIFLDFVTLLPCI